MNIRDICIAALMTTAIATANGNAMAGNIKTYRSGPVNITVEKPEKPALSVSMTDSESPTVCGSQVQSS